MSLDENDLPSCVSHYGNIGMMSLSCLVGFHLHDYLQNEAAVKLARRLQLCFKNLFVWWTGATF